MTILIFMQSNENINFRVLMFHAIEVERLCINCLRLSYFIALVNLKILVFMYNLPKCLFARVSCGAWPGARVCNCAVAHAARAHPWLRARS